MKAIAVRRLVAVLCATSLWLLTAGTSHAAGVWHGVAAGGSPNIRSAPTTGAAVVGSLRSGQPVDVIAWVNGQRVDGQTDTWGELAPGEYVYGDELVKPKPSSPPPAPRTFAGHWIDINLTQQVITAYNGSEPVHWAVMSSGAPGWETQTGVQQVLDRVANETMSSATLRATVAIPYNLPNVLWTQYFTTFGQAIHDNYWKGDSPFGVPTSHGCVGLPASEAHFFWNWAGVGTVVNVHY